jgi:phosphoribosylformylglycinamidine cyclo-ligase
VDNLHIIKDNLFETPPLFKLIQECSSTDWKEMYKVFNMGHRMEVYLNENHAQQVIDISTHFGVEAKIIGRVESANKKQVTIKSEQGDFTYN